MFASHADNYLTRHPGLTDLFFVPGRPAMGRVDGELVNLGEKVVTEDSCRSMIRDLVRRVAGEEFEIEYTKEFSVDTAAARWRVSIYRSMGDWRVAARRLRDTPPLLHELGFTSDLARKMFGGITEGLILIAGPTGSGKTTTCMGVVQNMLRRRPVHVITVEDPVEYLLEDGRGLASQREVGGDVESFASGLRDALRQNPDVIVPGEARDPETCEMALRAAETGHLVLTTIHAATLEEAVSRVVSMHPNPKVARRQLSGCLRLLLVQRLNRREEGGLELAFKAVRGSKAVNNIIANGRERELDNESLFQKLSSQEMTR